MFGVKRTKKDYNHYVISDLGLAYDTPIVVADIPIFKKLIESPAIVKKKPLDSIFNRIISLYDKSHEHYDEIAMENYTFDRKDYARSNPHNNILDILHNISYSYLDRGVNFVQSANFMKEMNEAIDDFYNDLKLDIDYERFSSYVIGLYKKSLSVDFQEEGFFVGFINEDGLDSISVGQSVEVLFSKSESRKLQQSDSNAVDYKSELIPVVVDLSKSDHNHHINNSEEIITYVDNGSIVSIQGIVWR